MWLARAVGESAFRLALLTAPTALVIALIFPVQAPASAAHFALFVPAVLGSFLLMGAINFMIGTCAVRLKSILALIRAKYWLMELLSGLLIPMTFFPEPIRRVLAWLPFEHVAFTPLQIYLGKLAPAEALLMLAAQWFWVVALLWLGARWWSLSSRKITIHGG
jgi:ABC-2 type transport system permease protein